MCIISEFLNLDEKIQINIFKYIPDIKVILLLELEKKQQNNIKLLESKIKRMKTVNIRFNKYIYKSCSHTNYNTERWYDYEHTQIQKRCTLCNKIIKYCARY